MLDAELLADGQQVCALEPVTFAVDALLRGDLTTIVVDNDEYMDERMLNRIRFSIAHELGHFVLHKV